MSGGAWTGVAVTAVTAVYALASQRLASTAVSSAMVFMGAGIVIGPVGFDLVNLEHDAAPVLMLLEVTLALVLFTDAMAVRRRDLRSGGFVPLRLLALGLPLAIGAGWLLAWPLLPGLTTWELALVGAMLAPTDMAIARTAITSPGVPVLVRRGLNVESGLNDGLVLPFFLLFLAALPGTTAAQDGVTGVFWRSLVLSGALGAAAGLAGGLLLQRALTAQWVAAEWRPVFVLAVAALAYGLAAGVHGSGFIAAWVAGFAFAGVLRRSPRPGLQRARAGTGGAQSARAFVESVSGLLAALSLLVFGAVLLGPTLEHLTWQVVLYAGLSLTVVRMVPVALSLAGTGLRVPTVGYLGWFGPRGLASMVLALLVVEEHLPGTDLMGRVVAATVGLSVLLHGLSAVFLSHRYGRWYKAALAHHPTDLRERTPEADVPARDGLK